LHVFWPNVCSDWPATCCDLRCGLSEVLKGFSPSASHSKYMENKLGDFPAMEIWDKYNNWKADHSKNGWEYECKYLENHNFLFRTSNNNYNKFFFLVISRNICDIHLSLHLLSLSLTLSYLCPASTWHKLHYY